MNGIAKPPPLTTAVAAAAGGFVGAVAGAIVAASMTGSPDDSNAQSALDIADNDKAVVAAER